VRAVLDANVLVAALLSRAGAPAQILELWLAGEVEIFVSELLLAELERILAYPKLRARVSAAEAEQLVLLLRETAVVVADPPDPPSRSPDPGDDYLLALAEAGKAVLVSGDQHVLGLADRFPIQTARAFLELLRPRSAD
jgi:putative PIN family toxin of toxin-antitoxin system